MKPRNFEEFGRHFQSRFKRAENRCLEWQGSLRGGYGRIGYGGKLHDVHRVAYELFCGPVPPDHDVLHHCDNRKCGEPAHLFTGTHTDNMADMGAKGRKGLAGIRGEEMGNARLTEGQVREIRANTSLSQSELAVAYGVVRTTISAVVTGRSWRHLLEQD